MRKKQKGKGDMTKSYKILHGVLRQESERAIIDLYS